MPSSSFAARPSQQTQASASHDRPDPRRLHRIARAGLSSASRPFPHAERIRRAFGEHAPAGLSAHMGPAATEAGHAMGASGYVLNGVAAFTGTPDIRTAAHEAFHLFEQAPERARPNRSIGHDEDRSEALAERVAEGVAAGRSIQPLLANARAAPVGLQLARFKDTAHEKVKVNSSKLRFFRRLQLGLGGSRNLAMIKFVKRKGRNRTVLYVVARSMGLGVEKLTLRDEVIKTKAKTYKKRSHSEAVLRATQESGEIRTPNKRFKLSEFTPEYASSTNEACGASHENCSQESVPFLSDKFYFAQDYSGSKDSQGFEKKNNRFQRDVRNDDDQSETESEEDASDTEVNAVIVDEKQFVGLNQKNGALKSISATPLIDFFKSTPKAKRRAKIYDPSFKAKPPKSSRNKKLKTKVQKSRKISGFY